MITVNANIGNISREVTIPLSELYALRLSANKIQLVRGSVLISEADLSGVTVNLSKDSEKLGAELPSHYAKASDLASHTSNTNAHITPTERIEWNKQYMLNPVNGTNKVQLLKDGVAVSELDLSTYLDDTNLARLVSGTVDANGLATFKRDDDSTFTVDFSSFVVEVAKDSERLGGELPNYYAKASDLASHTDNTDVHITPTERIEWNKQYTLNPVNGTNKVQLLKDGIAVSEIDLTSYLDDTNLARLVSGTVDANGLATFKRDDNSTFIVDFSNLTPKDRVNGSLFDLKANQIGYRVASIGAIKIDVPPGIQMNALALSIDVNCGYQSPLKTSFNITVNFRAPVVNSDTYLINEGVRINTSDVRHDFPVRFENGQNPAIYIGEVDADFRYSIVSITSIRGTLNEGGTPEVFERIKNEFQVSLATSFESAGGPITDNLVQGKKNPLQIVDNLGSPVFATIDYLKFSDDFLIDAIEQKLSLKAKRYTLFKDVSYDKLALNTRKCDLLDQTFVVNEIIRSYDTLDLVVNLDLFVPSGEAVSGNFNFTIDCDLNRSSTFGLPIIKIQILNFDNTKVAYIQNLVIMHKLMLLSMNGFKYVTKTYTIDCSKPQAETTTEIINYPREYFDYPISDNINSVDNNKLRLNFPNSPFSARIRTFIKKY